MVQGVSVTTTTGGGIKADCEQQENTPKMSRLYRNTYYMEVCMLHADGCECECECVLYLYLCRLWVVAIVVVKYTGLTVNDEMIDGGYACMHVCMHGSMDDDGWVSNE